MKLWALLFALVPGALACPAAAAGQGRLPLRILYIGSDKARTAAYADFLRERFSGVRVAQSHGFEPAAARDADVVLLDWSPEADVKNARSPLGRPEAWSKPTVLLGSAGLMLAGQWQLIGGDG
jgi:hypothetical protein